MRIGRLGNISLECSPLVLLPAAYALLAGKPGAMLLNLFALFLHEFCHTLTARALGCRVKSIELQPFGFVARMERRIASRWDELAIAAAGPLFSLVASIACSAFGRNDWLNHSGRALLEQFGRINGILGIINLLPALPLDGGRMAEALLRSALPPRAASRALLLMGAAAGLAAAGFGFLASAQPDDARILLCMMGFFLILAVLRESRRTRDARIDTVLRRMDNLRSGGAIPVRFVALHASALCEEALSHTDPRTITYILVVNDALEEIGRLSEPELLDGIARLGMDAPLHGILMLR